MFLRQKGAVCLWAPERGMRGGVRERSLQGQTPPAVPGGITSIVIIILCMPYEELFRASSKVTSIIQITNNFLNTYFKWGFYSTSVSCYSWMSLGGDLKALGKYKVQDQVLNEGFPHLPYLMRYFRAQCKRFADRLPHRVWGWSVQKKSQVPPEEFAFVGAAEILTCPNAYSG